MAFSSNDMSAPSNIQVTFPEETSQIGNPNLIDDDIHGEHGQKLKELVKHIFSKVRDDSFEGLAMIDAVQRLGIDYYFQDEISEILQKQYMFGDQYGPNNLQEVALRFRLLRAEGYYQSPDIFNKYKNKEGKFNKNLSEDINGLMSLYEASQLSIEGEDVLDEAGDFIANLFNECMEHLDNCQATVVKHIFAHPYRKSLFSSFMAKNFAPGTFQGEYEWLQYLQQLAKMDFNMNQSLHRQEIVHISKWWKDLGLAEELKFARDQPVKWYIWSMACFTDPRMSWQRIDLTKPISLVYIIDDIFDVYGSLEELTLFTEIVNRWDLLAIDRLPDYMKLCFEALNNITNEISCKVYKMHGHNPVQSLRKAWASLCNAFLVEARWFASGHLPKAEEYLKNGIISSGVNVGLVHVFFLLGDGVTRESVQLIDDIPAIISSIATILRLWDDLGSAKDENQNGKDGSYINYYMNEHQDSTSEEAQKHAMKKISEAWKNLNKACLCSNPFSATFKRASLNVARMVPLMYSYDENQRLPSLEAYIKSLFENLPTRGVY